MSFTVLHIAHYAAAYRGNFIESLEQLDALLKKNGGKNVYMFPAWAKTEKSYQWLSEMQEEGKSVYYFSENVMDNWKIIRKIIVKENIQIIHTHFLPAKYQIGVKLACCGSGIKQVIHFHNHSELKQGMSSILRRKFYKNSIMISCSKSVHQSVCRDYPKNRKFELDNGIDTSRIQDYTILKPSDFGFDNEIPLCLMFGFDFERKGVDLACLTIQKLWEEGKKVNLLISVSRNFEEVELKIKGLLGHVPSWLKMIPSRNDVASLYNAVQVFLSPSREEGLPYSALEAGYCQCAVVLSDIEAQKLELDYAVWFSSDSWKDFADAILKGIDLQKEKVKHLSDVQKKITSRYSVTVWSEGMFEIYKQL